MFVQLFTIIMNVSQIALYLYKLFFCFRAKTKKWVTGMLDLAIVGTASLSIFTLHFMVIILKSSRTQPNLRTKIGKVN